MTAPKTATRAYGLLSAAITVHGAALWSVRFSISATARS